MVTGGVNRCGKILGDAWVLDVDNGRWRKVRLNCTNSSLEVAVRILFVASLSLQLSETLKPRWGHSITAFFLTDGETEVTLFGGTSDPQAVSDEKQSKLADTTLLQFCKGINTFISLYMYVLFYCCQNVCIIIINMVMFLLFYQCSVVHCDKYAPSFNQYRLFWPVSMGDYLSSTVLRTWI